MKKLFPYLSVFILSVIIYSRSKKERISEKQESDIIRTIKEIPEITLSGDSTVYIPVDNYTKVINIPRENRKAVLFPNENNDSVSDL